MGRLPHLLVNTLIGILKFILNNMRQYPNCPDDIVLIQFANTILPALREIESIS